MTDFETLKNKFIQLQCAEQVISNITNDRVTFALNIIKENKESIKNEILSYKSKINNDLEEANNKISKLECIKETMRECNFTHVTEVYDLIIKNIETEMIIVKTATQNLQSINEL